MDLTQIDVIVVSNVAAALGLPYATQASRGFKGNIYAPDAVMELAASAMHSIAASLRVSNSSISSDVPGNTSLGGKNSSTEKIWHSYHPYSARDVEIALSRVTPVPIGSPFLVRSPGHSHASVVPLALPWVAGPDALIVTPQPSGLGLGSVYWLLSDGHTSTDGTSRQQVVSFAWDICSTYEVFL
jgi:Cft2 family RNA processing exonuclease